MAYEMKNIASITHNNKNVKKILDSNNEIVWGSYSTYPYRLLEYINFNGAEYVQTNLYAGTLNLNYQSEFSVGDTITGSNARTLIGIYDSSLADALRRFYPIWRGPNGIRCSIGNAWSSYATDFSLNDKLKLSMSFNASNNTVRAYWYLSKAGGSVIGSANPLNNTTTGNLNTTTKLKLGCQIDQSGAASNYWVGRIYNFQVRQNNASGDLLYDLRPCQRKSDKVCGMYDLVNNVFYPMVGTTITNAAAGPTIKEYFVWSKLNKGDILKIDAFGDGDEAKYRILKANGNVITLMGLDNIGSGYNSPVVKTTFDNGTSYPKYADSILDTFINTTYYSELSTKMKNAIIDEQVTQNCYTASTTALANYDLKITISNGSSSQDLYYKKLTQVAVGNRHMRAPDLIDAINYFKTGSNAPEILGTQLQTLFFEQTTSSNMDAWTMTAADTNPTDYVFDVIGYSLTGAPGYFNTVGVHSNSEKVCPIFKIDLLKIEFRKI